MLKFFARLALCIFAALLLGVALLYFRQHDMIYHPRPYPSDVRDQLPAELITLEYRTIAGAQVAFYLPRGSESHGHARLWIAFGGNGSLALEWLDFIKHDPNPADAFLLIDYPGYGRSEGYAAIATNRAAADGALEALKKHLGPEGAIIESNPCVLGHSFGTAAALDFATRHPVRRIVLIAPFTSLREEGALTVGRALSHLLIENYDNRARLRDLAARPNPPRIAIFHGTNDDIIPVRMGQELASEEPALAQFFPIEGGDHLSPLFDNAEQIFQWMNRDE